MKKRLSKQQQRGIKARQALAWRELADNEQQGVILSCYGKQAEILTLSGEQYQVPLRQSLRLAAGDKVAYDILPDGNTVIVAAMPRISELTRLDAYNKPRTVAANVEQLFITFAAVPEPSFLLIDQYLVTAAQLGIEPVLVANKIDLLDDDTRATWEHQLAFYEAHYRCLQVSSKKELGIDKVADALHDRVSIFVGQSGVGKSSLLQHFLPEEAIEVGELSERKVQGKHTTTVARYYPLAKGGAVIDSPGVRSFVCEEIDVAKLPLYFPEFSEYLGECRFRNCTHQTEKDCAIIQAVHDEKISALRWQNYCTLYENYR